MVLLCKHGRYVGSRCLDCSEQETLDRITAARREERKRCAEIFKREMDKIEGCWLEDYISATLREIEKEPDHE